MSKRTRIVKNDAKWHKLTIASELGVNSGTLTLTGTGSGAFLWVGIRRPDTRSESVCTWHGQVALRKLARTILKTIPARKRRSPR